MKLQLIFVLIHLLEYGKFKYLCEINNASLNEFKQ